MYTHSLSSRHEPKNRSSRSAAGVALAVALMTAACSDSVTGVTSVQLNPSMASAVSAISGFAILGNAAVTCTDGNIIGDVGTFLAPPTGGVTLTTCPVSGAVHAGDGAAIAAYEAFLAEYAALAPVIGEECIALSGSLSGVSLAPGSYCFDAAAVLTGVLTLDGPSDGSWVFKVGTSGTGALTGTSFSMVIAGGALPCNVTWWVSQAATMTDSRLIGSIFAGAAITLTRGTFDGNAYSQAGVTVTGTAVSGCDRGSAPVVVEQGKCNQGPGNGFELCDPGNSNHRNPSNDENGGAKGRKNP